MDFVPTSNFHCDRFIVDSADGNERDAYKFSKTESKQKRKKSKLRNGFSTRVRFTNSDVKIARKNGIFIKSCLNNYSNNLGNANPQRSRNVFGFP
jgi:hypothetical protein